MNVNILSVDYDLIIDTKKLLEYCDKYNFDKDTTQGMFLEYERRIVVRDDISPEQIIHTILHEIIHAIAEITGQTMLNGSKKGEGMTNALAFGLVSVLKNENLYNIFGQYLKEVKK